MSLQNKKPWDDTLALAEIVELSGSDCTAGTLNLIAENW